LTGGIREGAKGEPPVGLFSRLALVIHELRYPAVWLGSIADVFDFSNFFLFIHSFFGIRHDPGGNLSIRLAIESCSASLFSRGLFHQQ
jgi:hypothetical protein